MSFLIVFIRLAIAFMMLFLVVFFGGREIILYWASSQIISDARVLTIPQRWRDAPGLCPQPIIDGPSFDGFQVRFIDDNSYNLEVRCTNQPLAVRETKTLPFGVKKTTGSAGFFYDYFNRDLSGEITLELWGQKKILYVEQDRVRQVWGETEVRASLPASVCTAHGLKCCNALQEVGVGEPHSAGVTDCPATCYASCMTRPILLSFQTDPPIDHERRLVRLAGTSALVAFNYVFDDREADIETVTIDFGDGDSQIDVRSSGQFSKQYSCNTGRCVYEVTLSAIDTRGVEAAQTRLANITVELGVQ